MALESTGVYWILLFGVLEERGLVNAIDADRVLDPGDSENHSESPGHVAQFNAPEEGKTTAECGQATRQSTSRYCDAWLRVCSKEKLPQKVVWSQDAREPDEMRTTYSESSLTKM